ncbi:hypothetical protein BDV18DRAFT_128588 [Aspergillus unguis]
MAFWPGAPQSHSQAWDKSISQLVRGITPDLIPRNKLVVRSRAPGSGPQNEGCLEAFLGIRYVWAVFRSLIYIIASKCSSLFFSFGQTKL